MVRISVVLILMFAALPPGSIAETFADRTSRASDIVRNEAALALIDFPWQQLQYTIVFLAPQHGVRAMTISRDHKIEIYARPEDDSLLLAYDIAHELGHAIDLTQNNGKTRRKWMVSRGIDPATPWFGCNRCSDYNTPAGDFAETFAFLLLGPGHFAGRIAPPPTTEEIRILSSFFPEMQTLPPR